VNGASGWWHWCALWLATFAAFAAVAHGNLETTDAGFTMQAARGLWQRGDSGLRTAAQGGEVPGETAGADYLRQGKSGKVGLHDLAYPWFPVGHVWLLVPLVAMGEPLDRALAAADATFRERVARGAHDQGTTSIIQGRPIGTQGLISLLLPPACAASTLLLLLQLARTLGANRRAAAITALSILFATQGFAFGRETLSDGPGLTFLLGALLAVVAVQRGKGSVRSSLLGGLAAGAAVLLRYQNAALLIAVGVVLVGACWRQRRWRNFGAFTCGVLPAAALLLAVDYARFGDPFDTGYPKVDDWLVQPMWLGATKILFAAGRGVAWFSPLVWLALPCALSRRAGPLRWLGWALFMFPLSFFALANGWQGGQCWAARYVTHGLVALLVLTLPHSQPWRRWPKAWLLLVLLGLFVNVTSVVAPVRGVRQLSAQAVAASGAVGDEADITSWQPRYSPLWVNWRYAFASHVGGFEDEHGHPRNGSAHTIEALFGVVATAPAQALAPIRWEDRCGRHLWWRFWGDLLGIASWALLLPCLLGAFCFAALARAQWGLRRP
jgi:hypothetical protein